MNSFQRTLVTTALPYANGPVHIGHLAGVYVPADIYVRYLRLKGENVLFIGGSDEHGVPVTIRARKEGITTQDKEVADYLRKTNKPIILVVNKIDNNEVENTYEFYELNLGVPFPISSEQSKGIGDLLDEIVSHFKTESKVDEYDENKIKAKIFDIIEKRKY